MRSGGYDQDRGRSTSFKTRLNGQSETSLDAELLDNVKIANPQFESSGLGSHLGRLSSGSKGQLGGFLSRDWRSYFGN